jgi:hypothetical protein
LPRISEEGGAAAKLLDDPVGIGAHRRRRFGSRRKEDFGNLELLGALGGIQSIDDRRHFVFGDVDERLDLPALQARPGHFAVDLPLQGLGRCTVRAQEVGHLSGRHLELRLGVSGEILVDLALGDLDVGLLGRLDLEHLVDEVAKHLLAKARKLLGRDRASGRHLDDREPVVDLGAGDDGAVDDRRRLAKIGIFVGDELRVGRDVEARRRCRRGVAGGLRKGRRRGQRAGQQERRPVINAELHHSSN